MPQANNVTNVVISRYIEPKLELTPIESPVSLKKEETKRPKFAVISVDDSIQSIPKQKKTIRIVRKTEPLDLKKVTNDVLFCFNLTDEQTKDSSNLKFLKEFHYNQEKGSVDTKFGQPASVHQ